MFALDPFQSHISLHLHVWKRPYLNICLFCLQSKLQFTMRSFSGHGGPWFENDNSWNGWLAPFKWMFEQWFWFLTDIVRDKLLFNIQLRHSNWFRSIGELFRTWIFIWILRSFEPHNFDWKRGQFIWIDFRLKLREKHFLKLA